MSSSPDADPAPEPPARSDPPVPSDKSAPPEPASSEPSEPSASPGRPEPAKRTSALGARPRDMVISLLFLLPLVGLFAFLGRGCSFSPLGPTIDPKGPAAQVTVNPRPALAAAARRVPFPVREPATPAGWRVTSVDQRLAPGGASAVRVGWLTAEGRYARLVQTATSGGAEEGPLVADETDGPPTAAEPFTTAGAPWVRYTGANGEQAWTRVADGVRWLITGSATPAEFQAIADAVTAAAPLPRAG